MRIEGVMAWRWWSLGICVLLLSSTPLSFARKLIVGSVVEIPAIFIEDATQPFTDSTITNSSVDDFDVLDLDLATVSNVTIVPISSQTLQKNLPLFDGDDELLFTRHKHSQAVVSTKPNMTLTPVVNPVAPQPKLYSQQHLFSSFAFKGVALSVSKATSDWTSMAIGFKLPITPNFPIYDSKIYLPKVNAFIGIGLPLSLRMSVTASIPTQAIVGGAMLLYHLYKHTHSHPQTHAYVYEWPSLKPKDNIKRIGVTLSCRVWRGQGLHPTLGVMCMFLPGLHIVHKLLPIILLTPTVFVSMLQMVYVLYMMVERSVEMGMTYIQQRVLPRPPPKDSNTISHTPAFSSSSPVNAQATYVHRVSAVPSTSPTQLAAYGGFLSDNPPSSSDNHAQPEPLSPIPSISIGKVWQDVYGWVTKKSPSFTYNLARNYVFGLGGMGKGRGGKYTTSSTVQFDLQPFYPFQNFFRSQAKKARSKIRQRSQNSGAPQGGIEGLGNGLEGRVMNTAPAPVSNVQPQPNMPAPNPSPQARFSDHSPVI